MVRVDAPPPAPSARSRAAARASAPAPRASRRRRRPCSTSACDLLRVAVEGDDLVARREQAQRHVGAHAPEPDHPDLHRAPPCRSGAAFGIRTQVERRTLGIAGKASARSKRLSNEREKQLAAEAAAALVEPGMTVGLGTGSTVGFLLPALARRALAVRCVASSVTTEHAARALGLHVEPFDRARPPRPRDRRRRSDRARRLAGEGRRRRAHPREDPGGRGRSLRGHRRREQARAGAARPRPAGAARVRPPGDAAPACTPPRRAPRPAAPTAASSPTTRARSTTRRRWRRGWRRRRAWWPTACSRRRWSARRSSHAATPWSDSSAQRCL